MSGTHSTLTVRHTATALLGMGAAALLLGAFPVAAQQAAQSFDAARVVASNAHRFEELVDLDADGWMDALDWYWGDPDYDTAIVSGWMNDHTGALAPAWSFTVQINSPNNFFPTDAAIGNLNGDALPDFALSFDARVFLYRGNGAAPPTPYAVVNGTANIDSIVLADFDANGLDDLACSDGYVTIWRNQGAGVMVTAGPAWNTIGGDPDDLHVVDADGDGHPDLMNLYGASTNFYVIVDAQLASQFSVFNPLLSDPTDMLATGDVDGDGDVDGVIFQMITQRYSVVRHGSSGWVGEAPQVGGPATRLADVTGDGIPDGVCCSSGGGGLPTNTSPSKFEIAVNDGTGNFAKSFPIESLGSHHIAGVADLDHDGDADLVAGRTIYYARGPLTAPPHPDVNLQAFPLGVAGPTGRFVCDADGDGDPDLGFGVTSLVENDGAAGLAVTAYAPLPVPDFKKWLGPGHPGDFDGDGDVDLLVTRWQGPFFSGVYLDNWLLRNNGSGVLYEATLANASGLNLSPSTISYWDNPQTSVVADLDADGDLDIALMTTDFGGSSRLWLNDGTGVFTHDIDIAGGSVQAVVDLSGDGLPDLVLNTLKVEVRFGLGGGAFDGGVAFPATPLGTEATIAVLDVDGNGTQDLVAAKRDSPSLHVYVNDGRGSFTLDAAMLAGAPIEPQFSTPHRVLAADVDADGLTDLLAYPVDDAVNATWVLLRNPSGAGFEPGIALVMTPTAVTDVDGDGDGDVLGHTFQDAHVLLHNTTWAGPDVGARLQYGVGASGTGGITPKLGATGPFRVNEVDSLHMTGLPGAAIGIISVGLQSSASSAPFYGSTSYNWPWALYLFLVSPPAQPGVNGSSALVLPYVVPASAAGVGPLYHQIYFADKGNPYGRVASGGLMIDYD